MMKKKKTESGFVLNLNALVYLELLKMLKTKKEDIHNYSIRWNIISFMYEFLLNLLLFYCFYTYEIKLKELTH